MYQFGFKNNKAGCSVERLFWNLIGYRIIVCEEKEEQVAKMILIDEV